MIMKHESLTAHAQAKKKHKAFQEELPTAGNNRSVELGSRNTSNLAHIDYFMEKHFAPLNRRDTQEPEVLGENGGVRMAEWLRPGLWEMLMLSRWIEPGQILI